MNKTIQEMILGEEKIYMLIDTMTDKNRNVNLLNVILLTQIENWFASLFTRESESPKLCNNTRLHQTTAEYHQSQYD